MSAVRQRALSSELVFTMLECSDAITRTLIRSLSSFLELEHLPSAPSELGTCMCAATCSMCIGECAARLPLHIEQYRQTAGVIC